MENKLLDIIARDIFERTAEDLGNMTVREFISQLEIKNESIEFFNHSEIHIRARYQQPYGQSGVSLRKTLFLEIEA